MPLPKGTGKTNYFAGQITTPTTRVQIQHVHFAAATFEATIATCTFRGCTLDIYMLVQPEPVPDATAAQTMIPGAVQQEY